MRRLISSLSVAALLVGVLAVPVNAGRPALWATINGGGTSMMEDGAGRSVFGMGVKLYSDGSASGEIDCVDLHGDAPGYPGNIWGQVTSWSIDDDGFIVLNVIGKFHPIPGGQGLLFRDVTFTVRIQQFGGKGVGHWTLEDTASGFVICFEILTSGQIVMRLA